MSGSPPRVWGKQCTHIVYFAEHRFTPTCVGKTSQRIVAPSLHSVHPHVCGENRVDIKHGFCFYGSPPRVWGKLPLSLIVIALSRFTPTCVGKTPLRTWNPKYCAVHPHVCGENDISSNSLRRCSGSPPRVWGKLRTCAF